MNHQAIWAGVDPACSSTLSRISLGYTSLLFDLIRRLEERSLPHPQPACPFLPPLPQRMVMREGVSCRSDPELLPGPPCTERMRQDVTHTHHLCFSCLRYTSILFLFSFFCVCSLLNKPTVLENGTHHTAFLFLLTSSFFCSFAESFATGRVQYRSQVNISHVPNTPSTPTTPG